MNAITSLVMIVTGWAFATEAVRAVPFAELALVLIGSTALLLWGTYVWILRSTTLIADFDRNRYTIEQGVIADRLLSEQWSRDFAQVIGLETDMSFLGNILSRVADWLEKRGVRPSLLRLMITGTLRIKTTGEGAGIMSGLADPQSVKKELEELLRMDRAFEAYEERQQRIRDQAEAIRLAAASDESPRPK